MFKSLKNLAWDFVTIGITHTEERNEQGLWGRVLWGVVVYMCERENERYIPKVNALEMHPVC